MYIITKTGTHAKFFENFDIRLKDIAYSLSKICRFNGHTSRFYSVAEHSIYTRYYSDDEFALTALLHDAHEAYCGDICSPFKKFLSVYDPVRTTIHTFKEYEDILQEKIMRKFGGIFPVPEEVHQADRFLLEQEIDALIKHHDNKYVPRESTCSHDEMALLFLREYENLCKK